jgi:Cytochrome P460
MKHLALLAILGATLLGAAALDGTDSNPVPTYAADGALVFPAGYRDWNFVTSGLGMSYSPPVSGGSMGPMFDNVFVTRDALRAFRETGRWPDPTTFVIEVRGSNSHGSINKDGHYQADLMGFDVEVKDSRRPGTWQYYGFDGSAATKSATGQPLPHTASCYECHSKNAAVEHTFVQFYPALFPIAQAKGTVNPGFHE